MKNGIALLLFCWASAASAACSPRPGDAEAVTGVMRDFFVAAAEDDLAKFHSLTLPGFYAYDVGKRWEGDSLMRFVIQSHQQGFLFAWSVTAPEVHVDCDMAWIAYVNQGAVQKPGEAAPAPLTWLESATLQRQDKEWKLAFLHSTRVPAASN